MQVNVRLFATLRQIAGWNHNQFDVADGATVSDVINALDQRVPQLNIKGRTVYIAVNQEYARGDLVLKDSDEVAFFPPVSGGADMKRYEITDQALSLDDVAKRVASANCGAIVTFAGVVRGATVTADGVRGTDFLNYEAYAEMAEKMLARIGDEIRQKWPMVEAVSILHRTGRLEIGEPSVVIAVATPHRGDGCFDACHYAIERLKAIVPIWKQENWSDGSIWVEGPREPELTAQTDG